MRFELTRDATEFATHAEAFLAAQIERNVLATVLIDALDGRYSDTTPLFCSGLHDDGGIGFACLRTPGRPLLVCELDPALADPFLRCWLNADPELPGVDGPSPTASAIATAWERLTGGTVHRHMSEAMHVAEAVCDPPRPARGHLRGATQDDRELLTSWWVAFAVEVKMPGRADEEAAARLVAARLRAGALHVWEDDGPASLVGVQWRVGGVSRIGPVYTPPERRRRGYAGSAVAAASRRELERGAVRCMLFTDLSNPTSNKIYAEVGYRRFGDWETQVFRERRTQRAPT